MNKKGFGYVKVDEDREFYIHDSNMKDALNKDTVLIEKIPSHGQKEEGRVVRVIKRGQMRYVGEVKRGKRAVSYTHLIKKKQKRQKKHKPNKTIKLHKHQKKNQKRIFHKQKSQFL